MNEQFVIHPTKALTKLALHKIIKESLYAFPEKEIAALLRHGSKNPEKVAEPIAVLLSGLSHEYLFGITRSISFTAGFLIKDKKLLPKFEQLLDGGKVMHDVLLNCTLVLYRKVGLPLK